MLPSGKTRFLTKTSVDRETNQVRYGLPELTLEEKTPLLLPGAIQPQVSNFAEPRISVTKSAETAKVKLDRATSIRVMWLRELLPQS